MLKGLFYLRLIDLLRGTNIYGYLQLLRHEQFKSRDDLKASSKELFDSHLSYAAENTLYYNKLFSRNNQVVLTKDLIRNNFNELRSACFTDKVFTREVLEQLDVNVIKDKFKFPDPKYFKHECIKKRNKIICHFYFNSHCCPCTGSILFSSGK